MKSFLAPKIGLWFGAALAILLAFSVLLYLSALTPLLGSLLAITAAVLAIFLIRRDLILRQQAEEALRNREERLTAIFNALGEGLHGIDREGKIIFENPAAAAMLGWSLQELIGRSAHPLMHHTHANGSPYPESECPMYATLHDGVSRRITDEVFWRKDGTGFPVEYTSTPIRNAAGEVGGAVVAFLDITERKQAETQLLQTNQTLEETNRKLMESQTHLVQSEKMASLGQLVAGIAHEINNPLAFVANNLFTSEEGLERIAQQLDGAPAERLAKIRKRLAEAGEGVERVAELVHKLRTFSRLDEGVFKRVDTHESLDAVLLFLHHKMKERIQVEKHYGPHSTLFCTGELNQVLMNLVANAVDAIEGEGRITLTTGQREGIFFISVQDTGKGIPAAIQERIFEPFFTTKPVGQGTGLGLAIAHSIVQAHQGRIRVHSEEGRGTEMVIEIPLDLEARTGEPLANY